MDLVRLHAVSNVTCSGDSTFTRGLAFSPLRTCVTTPCVLALALSLFSSRIANCERRLTEKMHHLRNMKVMNLLLGAHMPYESPIDDGNGAFSISPRFWAVRKAHLALTELSRSLRSVSVLLYVFV